MPPYTLVRSRRRTIALTVSAEAALIVRAPLCAPMRRIERFIRDKGAWIDKTIARVRAMPGPMARTFIDGERFLVLGESYPLRVATDVALPLDFQETFVLAAGDRHRARDLFVAWYRDAARRQLTARVERYARQFGFTYRSVRITAARRRWGSCSATGRLNFSWRLIMAPPFVVDYVVLHELAHLRHHNHSRAFWQCVHAMDPAYAVARRWLRDHGMTLDL